MTTPAATEPAAQETPKAAAGATKEAAPEPKAPPAPAPKPEGGGDPKAEAGTKDPVTKPEGASGKTGEPAAGKEAEPKPAGEKAEWIQEYTLALPEGSPLSQADLDQISSFAKEKNLSKDQAELLVQREGQAITRHLEAQKVQMAAKVSEWTEASKVKFGDKLKETSERSRRALEAFAPKELIKVLDDTGMGNYPAFVEAWAAVGRAMAEDRILMPPAVPTGTEKADHEVFYGGGANAK